MSQKPPKVDKEFGYGAYSYDEIDNNNDYPQTYDSATDTRRRRRRQYTNHDDTGVPSIKERPSNKRNKSLNSTQLNENNNRKTTSQYHKHTNNHSHVKLQSGVLKQTIKRHRILHITIQVLELQKYHLQYLVQKRRPIENGVIPPLKENENDDNHNDDKNNSKQDQTAQRLSDNDVKQI